MVGNILLLAVGALVATGADPDSPSSAGARTEAEAEETPKEYEILAEFVTQDSISAVRYLDTGLVTLNDRCPVRLVRLNRRMEAAYVNGHPVGFC